MERHVLAALVGATWAFGAAADEVVLQPVRDNTLYQENAGNSNGAGYLFAGKQGGGSVRRALLRFDVAGAVPAGAQVAQVELNLHVSRAGFADPLPASLHRALADWGEAGSNAGERSGAGAPAQPGDATWSHRFYATQTWSAPGADFVAVASATGALGGIGNYTLSSSPGLVADVQDWLDTPAQNFGWVLRGDESQGSSARRIDSRESITPATRPALRIVYSVAPATVPVSWTARGVLALLLIALGRRAAPADRR